MNEFNLFAVVGVELEYMIVDAKRLNIRPIADRLLVDRDGEPVSDLQFGPIAWSNELVNHVVEFKTNGPAKSLVGLADGFHKNILAANKRLVAFGARLMPTAMHPWMNPVREKQLWFGDSTEIYTLFDQIFDCSGHGWCNVQSTHVNLPFSGDSQFAQLHAAIRLVLPLLPALAASSPFYDGTRAEHLDSRLHFYAHNCDSIPSITAGVIPEPVFSQAAYEEAVFQPMFRDIAPHDPEGILQEEFLNARGAIARFERGSIEIRVLDAQECPAADLAVVALVVGLLREIVSEQWSSLADQQAVSSDSLRATLQQTMTHGGAAQIEDRELLRHLGCDSSGGAVRAADLWQRIASHLSSRPGLLPADLADTASQIVSQGNLASRIVAAVGQDTSAPHLKSVYSKLCDCLAENRLFRA